MTKKPKLEVVLPCYNESKSLEKIVTRMQKAAQTFGYSPDDFQLIIVENGSSDDSLSTLDNLSKTDLKKWFRTVLVPVNLGYGFGIWSGLLDTTATFVGWSHADQQCDPIDVFRGLQEIEKHKPHLRSRIFAKGVRRKRAAGEIFVSRFYDFIATVLLGYRFFEINAQPKVFHRDLLALCHNPPRDFGFEIFVQYAAKKNGFVFNEFEVDFAPRQHGLSSWAFSLRNKVRTIFSLIVYMYRLRRETP